MNIKEANTSNSYQINYMRDQASQGDTQVVIQICDNLNPVVLNLQHAGCTNFTHRLSHHI